MTVRVTDTRAWPVELARSDGHPPQGAQRQERCPSCPPWQNSASTLSSVGSLSEHQGVPLYLDEAERLAERIAILHEGRIIAEGTLAELKALFPAAKVEYVEKQPTLEEIFLTIVGQSGPDKVGTRR